VTGGFVLPQVTLGDRKDRVSAAACGPLVVRSDLSTGAMTGPVAISRTPLREVFAKLGDFVAKFSRPAAG